MLQKKDFKINLLSIVVPSFNQEKTILKDIRLIEKNLKSLGYKFEIIIVIDGQTDNTQRVLKKLRSKNIKIVSYKENQGKGHAVRVGMLKAKGDVIGFIDAGMDIHPKGFRMLLNHMEWYDADVIVGSKLHPVSQVNYPHYRKFLSWGYRQITHLLFGFKIRDTQVGLKFFKKNVAKDVLPRLLVKTYAFDIEMLAVSYLLGYKKIYEAPIVLKFKTGNIKRGALIKTVFLMLWDTAAVFYRLKILNYYRHKSISKRKKLDRFRLSFLSR